AYLFSPIDNAARVFRDYTKTIFDGRCHRVSQVCTRSWHQWKPTRGGVDAILNDKQSSVSPDDLLALTQQCSNELLQLELEKTRLNSACFVETSPLDSISPVAKFAYSSSRAPSRNYRDAQTVDSPVRTRPKRRYDYLHPLCIATLL
ncbi:unnamed protein product, partial [Brassica oleracea var. botrytis]